MRSRREVVIIYPDDIQKNIIPWHPVWYRPLLRLLQLPELAIDPPISHDLIFRHYGTDGKHGMWCRMNGWLRCENPPEHSRIQDLWQMCSEVIWLVVDLPLWKMMGWVTVGMMKFPTDWTNKIPVPNHQPVILYTIHDGLWDVWYDSTSGCLAISKKSLDTGTSCLPSCVCWFINPKYTCYVHQLSYPLGPLPCRPAFQWENHQLITVE